MNILAQQVAVPVLYGSSSTSTTTAGTADGRAPLTSRSLSCGSYVAYWNGFLQGTNKEAASGMYLVQLFVDNTFAGTIRIFNRK